MHRRSLYLLTLFAICLVPCPARSGEKTRAENVIVVTLDGFRWQEFFSGADETLLDKKAGGVRDVSDLKKRYWRETAEERRAALLPFMWNTVAKKGQIFGDRGRNAESRLTNGLKFSYPGYSEMFCGYA